MQGVRVRLAGINIGGTSTTIVSGFSDGQIDDKVTLPTDRTSSAEDAYGAMRDALVRVAGDARAIGVAVGGPLDAARGIVTAAPHLPHLAGFPLRDRLLADLGRPVRVHHDAAACALAEYRWGQHAGVAGLAYLTCGTGFGAGLVLDGRVRYGRTGFAPEIGHVRFRPDGPDIFGKPGCYEGYGSANAIALLAAARAPARFAHATPAQVVAAASAGDADARSALHDNEAAVGSACALLADLLVLDAILLGSLAQYRGARWIDAVRAVFAREALSDNVARCAIDAAAPNVQDRSALAAAADAQETGASNANQRS